MRGRRKLKEGMRKGRQREGGKVRKGKKKDRKRERGRERTK